MEEDGLAEAERFLALEDEEDWYQPADNQYLDTCSMKLKQKPKVSNASAKSLIKVDHPRTIIHIDIDCFYAQVEMIHNPALRNVPLGVQQKNSMVTCNYPARTLGLTKLMRINEAKKKCPELVLINGEDLTRYREMSYKISECLLNYTPYVERLGFDENYLDVSEMVEQRIQLGDTQSAVVGHIFPTQKFEESSTEPCVCGCRDRLTVGSQIAAEIRSALNIQLGITCCAGISHNKLLAKLVGKQHKPDQQTTLFPCQSLAFVSGLHSAGSIPGIGWATKARLEALGVISVTDLQRFPISRLQEEFGAALAATVHQLSLGVDNSPVVSFSRPQVLSIEDSFRRCSSESDACFRITQLMMKLLPRMQEDGRTPHTLRLTVRRANQDNPYLPRESRQCSVPASVAAKISTGQLEFLKEKLVPLAMSLLHKIVDTKQPFHLMLINVAFTKLQEVADNNITSFFHTHSSASSSSFCPLNSSQKSSCSGKMNICGGNNKNEILPKSWDQNNIYHHNSFFVKKRRISNQITKTADELKTQASGWARVDNSQSKRAEENASLLSEIGPGEESILLCSASDSKEESVSLHSAVGPTRDNTFFHSEVDSAEERISLPSDIDPEVFSQLPADIQQEVLQQAANKKSGDSLSLHPSSVSAVPRLGAGKHSKPDSVSEQKTVIPLSEKKQGCCCKQKAILTGSRKGQSKSKLKRQILLSAKQFQPVFSQTKSIAMKVTAAVEADGRHSEAVNPVVRKFVWQPRQPSAAGVFTEQTCDAVNEPCPVSAETSPDCLNDCHPDQKQEFYGKLLCDSAEDSPRASSNIVTENSDRKFRPAKSLLTPTMAVPRGLAQDVFSSLPLEIQREIAAEMAMQKHNKLVPSAANSECQSRSQPKSPRKNVNSMLNYLQKR